MKNFQQTPRQARRSLEASKTRVKNSRKPQTAKVPHESKRVLKNGVRLDVLIQKQEANAPFYYQPSYWY